MGRRLMRFALAAFAALLVTFAMILFMRFLVVGYDDSASAALTRYISLPSFTINRSRDDEIKRVEKPSLMPELPVIGDDDLEEDAADYLEQDTLGMPALSSPDNTMKPTIMAPSLEQESNNETDKLKQLKNAILEQDE